MQANLPLKDVARDFLLLPGEIPGKMDGPECRPPRPAMTSRGLFVIAGKDAQHHRQTRVHAASPRKEIVPDLLSSPGEMPGVIDG